MNTGTVMLRRDMLTRCCDDAEFSLQCRFFQVDNHETDVVKSLVVISNRGHHFVQRLGD